MPVSALDLHDAMLLIAPDGSNHDTALCPFCTEWAMDESGIPSGYVQLTNRSELADAQKPYGDVEYADPGYQADKVKRYPIDTEAHARAAWSYIHQASNAAKYSADQLSTLRTKISAALKKFGVEAEGKEVDRERKLAEAKNAGKNKSAPKQDKSDAAARGGTHMDTPESVSWETHEALLEKALKDATASLSAEKASLEAQVTSTTEAKTKAETEVASLKSENERLNGELDTAQVALKSAQDESAQMKAEIVKREEETAKADLASQRATQVRNLALFTEEHITEKASRWADLDEASWTERVEEWKALKGASSAGTPTTDTASAISGTRDATTGTEPSARRRILGLA